jgi:hypothetical protein
MNNFKTEFLIISFYKKDILFIMSQSDIEFDQAMAEALESTDNLEKIIESMVDDRLQHMLNIAAIETDDKCEKVVVATYETKSVFKIPEELDLEGEFVTNWYVKYNVLYIQTVFNDKLIEIYPTIDTRTNSLKYPEDVEIEDATEYWM